MFVIMQRVSMHRPISACTVTGMAASKMTEACLKALDEVLLACLHNLVVLAGDVVLLTETLQAVISGLGALPGFDETLLKFQGMLTIEAEDLSPYSSMMLLVSLPSNSSGTETLTATCQKPQLDCYHRLM